MTISNVFAVKMLLAVPKWYGVDAATKQSYFTSEMFCGSQDGTFESPANDVNCMSVNIQDSGLNETTAVNISKIYEKL